MAHALSVCMKFIACYTFRVTASARPHVSYLRADEQTPNSARNARRFTLREASDALYAAYQNAREMGIIVTASRVIEVKENE